MIVKLISYEAVVVIVEIILIEAGVTNLPIIFIIIFLKSAICALVSAWSSACSFSCCALYVTRSCSCYCFFCALSSACSYFWSVIRIFFHVESTFSFFFIILNHFTNHWLRCEYMVSSVIPVSEVCWDFGAPLVWSSLGWLLLLFFSLVSLLLFLVSFVPFVLLHSQWLERVGVATDPPPAATFA